MEVKDTPLPSMVTLAEKFEKEWVQSVVLWGKNYRHISKYTYVRVHGCEYTNSYIHTYIFTLTNPHKEKVKHNKQKLILTKELFLIRSNLSGERPFQNSRQQESHNAADDNINKKKKKKLRHSSRLHNVHEIPN
jgi:hypothetical protein